MKWLGVAVTIFVIACQRDQTQQPSPGVSVKAPDVRHSQFKPLFLLEDRLQQTWLKEHKGQFLILVHGKRCPSSAGMEKALSLYEKEGRLPLRYRKVQLHQMEKLPIFATPWLLLVKDGQIVDGHMGASAVQNKTFKTDNRVALDNLLVRHGVMASSERQYQTSVRHLLRNKDLSHRALGGVDFSGQSMKGYHMKGSVLSGSLFAGTDLRGSNLSKTVAVKASFVGANLTGVSLQGSDWRQTICPDGQMSDAHGFSCDCCRVATSLP